MLSISICIPEEKAIKHHGATSLRLLGGWCGAGEKFVGGQVSSRWTTFGANGGSRHCCRFNALACGGNVPCRNFCQTFWMIWKQAGGSIDPVGELVLCCSIPKSLVKSPSNFTWNLKRLVFDHQYKVILRKGKVLWHLTRLSHASKIISKKRHIHGMYRSNRKKSGFSWTSPLRHGWRCPGVLETLLQAQADANLVASLHQGHAEVVLGIPFVWMFVHLFYICLFSLMKLFSCFCM